MFGLKSIRTQLTLLALAAVVPLLVLAAFEIQRHYEAESNDVRMLALERARVVSAHVDALVSNIDVLLTAISKSLPADPAFETSNDAQLRSIKAELPQYFNDVRISGADGSSLGHSEDTKISISGRSDFQEIIAQRRFTVSGPMPADVPGGWLLAFGRPVIGAGGEVEAVVSTSVQMARIQELLSLDGLPPDSIISVLNQDGVVLACSEDPGQCVGKNLRDRPFVQRVLSQKSGVDDGLVTADGVSRLSGYASPKRVAWAVYVGIPTAEAYAPARAALINGILLVLLGLAISAILITWLTARIAGPVRRLQQDTAILAAGNLSHQRSLEESEHRYRNFFDLTPLPMWVRDEESLRFFEVNDAALKTYGYTREEFLSMTTWDIRPPEDVERYQQVRLHRHNAETESRGIGRHRKKDGAVMDVEVTSHAVVFKQRPARLSVINDISERRRAEEALKDAERKYRTLFEDSPDGVMLVDPGNGAIIEGNQALRQMLGFSKEELSRLVMSDIEAAETPQQTLAHIEKVQREGSDEFETRLRTRSGAILDAFIRIRVLFIGSTMRFMTVVRDITERKRTEHALSDSEERLRTVANNIPALIGYIDAGQRYRYVNRTYEEWYGRAASDYFGRTVREVIGEDMYSVLQPHFEAALRGETVTEERRTRTEKDERYARFTYVPHFGGGSVLGFYVLGYDITERRKAENAIRELNVELERRVLERTAQLESANKELEAFSYSVSHDLRAPLRGIDGFSQALLEEYNKQLDEQGKDFLQRIRKSSQRMAQLIDDLLALSRVTRADMVRARVDLSALARDIAGELQKSQPGREVEFVIAPGLTANADRNLMRVVLDNLLANAWKFSGRLKCARIEFGETTWQARQVYFVRDSGAGFDMAYASKLFGAFQRLHDAKEFQGTGIGLATVQRIVRRHGGDVWGEGEVGNGATFYFSLGEGVQLLGLV